MCLCPIEICCNKCYQDLNWSCAIKPRICFVQLCSFTDETSAGNKAVHKYRHRRINTDMKSWCENTTLQNKKHDKKESL